MKMDDLFGDFQSSSNNASAPALVDLLSFESSPQPDARSSIPKAKASAQVKTLLGFDEFFDGSSVNLPSNAAAGRKHEHALDRNRRGDSGLVTIESSSNAFVHEEDDFGDFVDSPQPETGSFPTTIDATIGHIDGNVAKPADLLRFLLEEVLVVPASFITELAVVPYTLKRAILSTPRTKKWLAAMVEAGRIAQRIIHGRNRRAKDFVDRREAQLMTERLAQEWISSLVPRLSSLSGGALKLKALKINAYNDVSEHVGLCQVCGTEEEEEEHGQLLKLASAGLFGHSSCTALAAQHEQQLRAA